MIYSSTVNVASQVYDPQHICHRFILSISSHHPLLFFGPRHAVEDGSDSYWACRTYTSRFAETVPAALDG
jgi:hypothetical protein